MKKRIPKNKAPGAKMGGRVHWLLWELRRDFKRAYKLRYDYEYHNYHFTRYRAHTPIDQFIIIRTSKKCFRVMYFNYVNTYFEYFSETSAIRCAEHMEYLFIKIRRAEEKAKCEKK